MEFSVMGRETPCHAYVIIQGTVIPTRKLQYYPLKKNPQSLQWHSCQQQKMPMILKHEFFLDYLITQIYLKTTQLDIQKTVLTLQSISFLRLENKIKKKHMSRIQLRKWLHNVELQQIVIHMYTALWSVWCNTVWGQVQVLLWPFLSCGFSIKCIHSFIHSLRW